MQIKYIDEEEFVDLEEEDWDEEEENILIPFQIKKKVEKDVKKRKKQKKRYLKTRYLKMKNYLKFPLQ